jgi:cyanophycinase
LDTAPRLVIIGGAEDRTGECVILRKFVSLAGGAAARIVVLPAASEIASQLGVEYSELFRSFGAQHVEALAIETREAAKDTAAIALVSGASGLFLTGGDQLRLMNLLGGTQLDVEIHRRSAQGMVVGGTSAGAAVMSATMIVDGHSDAPRLGTVQTGPGLELIRGVIIDQHFAQRGRIGRLLSVVALFPHELGIGIDEDTALVVESNVGVVLGRGAVTVLDAGEATTNEAVDVRSGEGITLSGVRLHSLPAGRRFDFSQRALV